MLVGAVILSGGKVDLKNMTFELNSLGSGLKELLDAFSLLEREEKVEETANRLSGTKKAVGDDSISSEGDPDKLQ